MSINVVKMEFVREVDGVLEPTEDVALFVPDDGVDRGVRLNPGPRAFSVKFPLPLQPDSVDTLLFSGGGLVDHEFQESPTEPNFFSDGQGRSIALASEPLFDDSALDGFRLILVDPPNGIAAETFHMYETDIGTDQFTSHRLEVTLILPPNFPEAGVAEMASVCLESVKLDVTVWEECEETDESPETFTGTGYELQLLDFVGLDDTQPDCLRVRLTVSPGAAEFFEGTYEYILCEIGPSSRSFTSCSTEPPVFADLGASQAEEGVEVFYLRKYDAEGTQATIDGTLRSDIETIDFTLTRQASGEYLSGPIIGLDPRYDVSEVPNAANYTIIRARRDEADPEYFDLEAHASPGPSAKSTPGAFVCQPSTQYGPNNTAIVYQKLRYKLGYSTKFDCTITRAELKKKVKFLQGCTVFYYWGGHGVRDGTKTPPLFVGFETDDPKAKNFGNVCQPKDLPKGLSYDLVFLNCCWSQQAGSPAPAAFAAKFSAKAYVGWTQSKSIGFTVIPAGKKIFDWCNETDPATKKGRSLRWVIDKMTDWDSDFKETVRAGADLTKIIIDRNPKR